jgi:predicted small metal-binding protein
MKLVRCRDHGFDCPFEAHGTEEEVLQKTGEHAHKAHRVQVSAELVKAVKEKMVEVPDAVPTKG